MIVVREAAGRSKKGRTLLIARRSQRPWNSERLSEYPVSTRASRCFSPVNIKTEKKKKKKET